ncbi:hypothetical protein BpHYR1_044585, partial [Brachionus plicatilis]
MGLTFYKQSHDCPRRSLHVHTNSCFTKSEEKEIIKSCLSMLQKDLDAICQWIEVWRMGLCANKCK